MLDLGVEFGAEQNHDGGHPHPHHQADGSAERAVGRIVIGEVRQVPRQQRRTRQPCDRREHASHRKPFPSRAFSARPETIKHGQTENHHEHQNRPAQQTEQRLGPSAQTDKRQDDRQDHDRPDGGQDGKQAARGQDQRDEIEFDEAALFLLIVDDIERVDERLHSGIGAPQRQRQPERERKAELGFPLGGDAVHLLLDDVHPACGQETADESQVVVDGRCFREQPVERHERGDSGKQCEQTVKHHPGGHRQETVLADLRICAP